MSGDGLDDPVTVDTGWASVTELRRGIDTGALRSTELTQQCLDRIARLDPAINAVIAVHPDARDVAARSDRERAQGRPVRALEGIPVLVKDNIAVGGLPTTAGSLALAGSSPPDAFVVNRLRAAGAIIVGKTNLSEWANFRSARSTSGWSSVGGQTRNPHVLDRSPSGSSSGSAAAVAAHLAPLAVGTETDGSIVCPAAACGVVGVKPTLGMVSRTGIVPISSLQDTAGPMSCSVADAAMLLGVLAAIDPADAATHGARGFSVDALGADRLRGSRIGVWRAGSDSADPASLRVLESAVAALRDAGAELIDPVDLPGAAAIAEPELTALLREFRDQLDAHLRDLNDRPPRTLREVIEFNVAHADSVMPFFGQDLLERAEATGAVDAAPFAAARAAATAQARSALDTPLRQHRLDAVVALTAAPAWLIDPLHGDRDVFNTATPAAVSGYPAVTVPAGMVMGLPVGLTFMGGAWTDAHLLGLAYAFEHATRARRSPALLGSLAVTSK